LGDVWWNALRESDLIEFISQFSELRWGKILIFELNFVAKNSKKKKIAKYWVCRRKYQLRPGCVHTWTNSTGYTSIPPQWT